MKKIMAFATLAAMLASCSNDEDVAQQNVLKDTPVTITSAGVAELTPARAILEGALKGDGATLGLYVRDNNTKYSADHELYIYNGSVWNFSTEVAKDNIQVLFNGSSLDWIAYSPYRIKDKEDNIHNFYIAKTFSVPTDGIYNAGSEETTYKNVTSVSGSQYDLLWGKGTSGSGSLTPVLYHTLAMLTVNITALGTEIANTATIEAVKIGGTIPTGTLKLIESTEVADVVTIPENNTVLSAEIKALKLTTANNIPDTDKQYVASFEALIIPQNAALKLTIELSDKRMFTTTLAAREFSSGKHYNITLQVGSDTVTLDGISASRWNSTDGGNLATE